MIVTNKKHSMFIWNLYLNLYKIGVQVCSTPSMWHGPYNIDKKLCLTEDFHVVLWIWMKFECVAAVSCSKHSTQIEMFKVAAVLTFCWIELKIWIYLEAVLASLCSHVTDPEQMVGCLFTSLKVQLCMCFIARLEKLSLLRVSNFVNLQFLSWLLISSCVI